MSPDNYIISDNSIIITATLGTKPTLAKQRPFGNSGKYKTFGDNFKIVCQISADVKLKQSSDDSFYDSQNTTTPVPLIHSVPGKYFYTINFFINKKLPYLTICF